MRRSYLGGSLERVLSASKSKGRRDARRFRAGSPAGMELLEDRRLLANITASAIISSTPDGSDFSYTIALSNSSSSNAGIGTFWYAWVPGEDFLATSPLSVTPPTGWTDNITNMGSSDGYAIQYIANSSAYYVQPGTSLNFQFTSADTPSSVDGDSTFYPGTPVGTSFVYPTTPFSDGGHEFVVKYLASIAVTPANPSVTEGQTEQFDATGTYSDGSTAAVTNQVTWTSATTSVATISNASGSQGLATAVSTGTSTISAAYSGVTGSTVLTVSAPVLQSIAVTPANTSLPAGETEQFTATGSFSDGSSENLTDDVNWTSSDTTWATINSTGLATAVSPGPVTISATLDGISGSTGLTIVSAALQSIAVTPANTSLPVGETEQFTATGTFSDNSTENLTTQVTWASSDTTWATIDSAGLATAVSPGPVTISAALDGVSGSTGLTIVSAALQSIAVTPANLSIAAGLTEQFTATGTYSDKSTQNLTSQVTWASATTSVATISNASGSQGLATGVSTGTSTISATLNGITDSTVLTVTAAVLQSIAVTPADTSLPVGETEQFTATGTYSDKSTQNLTTQVTWASSDTTWATISSAGLASAVSPGPVTISATLDGITGSTNLTIIAAALESIAVTPANTSLPVGETEQFTATGTYSDKSTQNLTTQVAWASSDTTWATINSAGLATAVSPGPVTISATLNGITGSTGLTIESAVLQSIAVTPASPSIAAGLTEQFIAMGTYSDKSTQNLTSQVTWASATTSVATISNASGSQGLATGVSAGTSTISATLGGITDSTVLTVTAAVLQSIAVTPANTSLPAGETEQFTATGTFSDNSTENLTTQVTWASSDTTWATISSAGLATAVSPGPVTISATLDGISGSTGLTIVSAVLQSIAVTPANTSLPVGETEQFTSTGTFSDNSTENLTTQVTWASSDTTWATISSAGLATAVSPGPVTISATLDGVSGSTALTIVSAALESIAVTPANPSVAAGLTEQFIATGTYSDKSTQNLTSQVTWASATTSVATISNASGSQGLATGVSAGTSTISTTLGGITDSTVLTVTAAVLQSIAVTPANTSLPAGETEQFTATGTFSDNSTENLTTQVTWASATASVATISIASGSQGLATAVATGTSTISAALDGITGTTVLTVTASQPPTLSPVAVKANSLGGYYQYGTWTLEPGGYLGTESVANPQTSSNASARWMLTVPAGTYDFWASWVDAPSNATNTGYSIYDGFKKLGSVSENQQLAPDAGQYGGAFWADLGTFTVTNGKITVAMSASGANGDIVANGILLTSTPPATTTNTTSSDPGSATTVTSAPTGLPAVTTSGQDPAGSVAPTTGAVAPAPVSSPAAPPAPASSTPTPVAALPSITVNDSADSPTGLEMGSTSQPDKGKLTDRALRHVKAKHRVAAHESTLKRLARIHVTAQKHVVNHHEGR
jgi:trimeric autotransporter adhesin